MITTVLLVVAAVLVILAIVMKNWVFGAIALGAVILALIFGKALDKSADYQKKGGDSRWQWDQTRSLRSV